MDDFTLYINHLSIDCVVFGYRSRQLKVLISKVAYLDNIFALAGGFVKIDEDIDVAANRILRDRTSLDRIYLEQFKVFGKTTRYDKDFIRKIEESDQSKENIIIKKNHIDWLSKRFISLGYYALVDIEKVVLKKSDIDEKLEWIDINEIPKMIYDHNEIITEALKTLRENLDKKLIGFNLLPPTFTMKELQELYEVIYDQPFARNNFQKKMLDLNVLERLEKKYTGAANKAPYLYRFKAI